VVLVFEKARSACGGSSKMDDGIQKAIKMGEANKHVIQLAQNWCGHIGVKIFGGIGLVEIQTGLPIGHRSFKCPHAAAQGFAGADLRSVALDFYDRNCVGCKQRLPVRFPNLSQLVGERDTAQQRAKEAADREKARQLAKFEARAARREQLSHNCAPAQAGLFDLINRLDREPSEETKRILLETATSVPEKFNSAVQETLFELLSSGQYLQAGAAIETLLKIKADPARLCEAGLRLFASGHHSDFAGEAVQKGLNADHEPLIPEALAGIIHLAMSFHGFLGGGHRVGNPLPLLKVYELFPSKILAGVRDQLRGPEKEQRIEACNAVLSILQVDPDFGARIAGELIRSISLPDDGYGETGSAAHWAARSLAQGMLYRPDAIDTIVQEQLPFADEEKAEALLDVYHQALRRDDLEEGEDHGHAARALAYSRLVQSLTRRAESHALSKVVSFLQYDAKDFPDLLEQHAETLLGAAALIAEELDTPDAAGSSLSLKPDMLKALETGSRRMTLNSALNALADLMGLAASQAPKEFGASIIKMFGELGEQHGRLKSILVKCFGRMAANSTTLSLAIPSLYRAMTDQSSLVRSAAAGACGALARYEPEDLPELLHDTFLLLLSDPFVIVHQSAVEALEQFPVPQARVPHVIQLLMSWVITYRNSRSNARFLAACINQLLSFSAEQSLPLNLRDAIVRIIAEMDTDAALKVVRRQGRMLRGSAGYTALLVRLLAEAELSEYDVSDLVEELYTSDPAEIRSDAKNIVTAAKNCSALEHDITNELLEILTSTGAWKAAAEIARNATARFTDSVWDRPMRLRSLARQLSAEIEAASADGDLDVIAKLTARWRDTLAQMAKDDEDNQKNRNPVFGIPIPNPSE
jgi:HEAT repeat protein